MRNLVKVFSAAGFFLALGCSQSPTEPASLVPAVKQAHEEGAPCVDQDGRSGFMHWGDKGEVCLAT